jgi:hypothetical protein
MNTMRCRNRAILRTAAALGIVVRGRPIEAIKRDLGRMKVQPWKRRQLP